MGDRSKKEISGAAIIVAGLKWKTVGDCHARIDAIVKLSLGEPI